MLSTALHCSPLALICSPLISNALPLLAPCSPLISPCSPLSISSTRANFQARADAGLADAAWRHRLPVRVDTAVPSDLLASLAYAAVTAARITGDANPTASSEGTNWRQFGANALLPASLGVRPMLDVLWTTPTQQGDPRWDGDARRNIRHDLATAVLSTGPLGFGDLVGATDAPLLRRAMRADGVLLKPAFTALRLDRFYDASGGAAEIWAAPTGPAGTADARADGRANAFADLNAAASDPLALWWWVLIATNVDGSTAPGRPVQLFDLWPSPLPATRMLVTKLDSHVAGHGSGAGAAEGAAACVHGAPASSCARLWDAATPLDVSTAAAAGVERSFVLYSAAPVLASGWVLLGELQVRSPHELPRSPTISTHLSSGSCRCDLPASSHDLPRSPTISTHLPSASCRPAGSSHCRRSASWRAQAPRLQPRLHAARRTRRTSATAPSATASPSPSLARLASPSP